MSKVVKELYYVEIDDIVLLTQSTSFLSDNCFDSSYRTRREHFLDFLILPRQVHNVSYALSNVCSLFNNINKTQKSNVSKGTFNLRRSNVWRGPQSRILVLGKAVFVRLLQFQHEGIGQFQINPLTFTWKKNANLSDNPLSLGGMCGRHFSLTAQ